MYGLEAINAHNGWAMAVIGPLIVMSGLTILAIIISQLHKLVGLIERKEQGESVPKAETGSQDASKVPDRMPDDIVEAAKLYQPLIDKLEQPFELYQLYDIAGDNQYPHPHLTINGLRDAGILQDEGEGLFTWNH